MKKAVKNACVASGQGYFAHIHEYSASSTFGFVESHSRNFFVCAAPTETHANTSSNARHQQRDKPEVTGGNLTCLPPTVPPIFSN
jgi:hypothetical protein